MLEERICHSHVIVAVKFLNRLRGYNSLAIALLIFKLIYLR